MGRRYSARSLPEQRAQTGTEAGGVARCRLLFPTAATLLWRHVSQDLLDVQAAAGERRAATPRTIDSAAHAGSLSDEWVRGFAAAEVLCDTLPVRRAALFLLLTFFTFDVSGLSALCDEASCDEPCPTDLSGGKCPPNCHDCNCCSLPTTVAPSPVVALTAPAARETSWLIPVDRLPETEPADILHVPRPLLA